MDSKDNSFEVQKREENIVHKIPYALIADTLQRIIFYLSAIKSNNDSVILFEEPEAHSFPPYITMLAGEIVESKENQFFIATHSPYLFNSIVEKGGKDVAVFVCTYEDYQTKIKRMTDADLDILIDYRADVFSNLEKFDGK